jgi:hypothetical protein
MASAGSSWRRQREPWRQATAVPRSRRGELLEETGYGCDRLERISSLFANPATQTNHVHAFLAWDARPIRAQTLDPSEEGLTVELLDVETVLAGLGDGLIGQSMHVAAILQAVARYDGKDSSRQSKPSAPADGMPRGVSVATLSDPQPVEGMTVYGVDFTSAPSQRKPITCAECRLEGNMLTFVALHRWPHFEDFTEFLASPGPWIAGFDFPFGQSRRFIETIGWPPDWQAYVAHATSLSRSAFVDTLTDYRTPRAAGDKEHRRAVDIRTGAISPQKLYGIPVGLMFYKGAKRLLASNVHIPLLRPGDPSRIVVEAYPGVRVRAMIGRASYKNDDRAKQTASLLEARRSVLTQLLHSDPAASHGLSITAPMTLADDPSGDELDALICAAQAAWAYRQRDRNFGIPADADPLEGWICDPGMAEDRSEEAP